ncbi:MAG: hypothetical protein GY844_13770 [Bradyrhizobium sp.]|nr:hypothetical protein [Bradyrhizobium sp.]
MNKLTVGLAAIATSILFFSVEANATTYDFRLTSTIATANTPGISVGDTFTLDVFANNGQSSLNSQSWTASNVLYFTIHAGTYSATYSTVYASGFGFQTNASGNLTAANFFGTDVSSTNTDNFGTWMNTPLVVNGNAAFADFNGLRNFIQVGANQNIANWSVSEVPVAPTPLPAALPLFVSGLGALGLLGWRRKRNVQSAVAA